MGNPLQIDILRTGLLKIVLGLIPSLWMLTATAQSDSCFIQLRQGTTLFQQNEFDACIESLKKSLSKCNFDKKDKIEIYKTLIISYLYIDEIEDAEKTTLEIIKIDPSYKPDATRDDPRLSELFQKFEAKPTFRMGISTGVNLSRSRVKEHYSIVHRSPDDNIGKYGSAAGLNIAFTLEYLLKRSIWLFGSAQYQSSGYSHELFDVENTTVNYSERLNYMTIPITLRYQLSEEKISPYLEAGLVGSVVMKALSTSARNEFRDLSNRLAMRNLLNAGFLVGAGMNFEGKGFKVHAGMNYTYSFRNVNARNTRYDDELNVYKYFYIDDDFKLDFIAVQIGISQNLNYKNVRKNSPE